MRFELAAVVGACLLCSTAGLAAAPALRTASIARGASGALLPCKTVACQRRRLAMAPIASGAKDSGGDWVLDSHRWVQLGLLSLLALLSDWTCFATVAVPSEWMTLEGHDAAELIDLFLLSNVVSCFFFTDVANNFGLRKSVCAAAVLMAAGCLLRSGIPFFPGQLETMPAYGFEMAGTVLVAIAQPFFQCSPPLLSATWFGSSERALATATAINFNQVGIATAFIVGGLMANSPTGMHAYFDVLACCSIAAAVATLALFRERPETPPSASAKAALAEVAERAREREAHGQLRLEYPSKAFGLLRQPGFTIATATFVASIACTNVVSAFIAPALARAGLMEGMEIDLAGAGFQVAIVLGGIGLGRLVDQTKEFKKVILSCLVASAVLLAGLGISEGNDLTFSPPVVFALLLALGAAAGPVQPIAAELAVEVSYPCDENAVEATQQLAGNLFSAMLVPLCQMASNYDLQLARSSFDIRGDTIILLAIMLTTAAAFSTFDTPLERSLLDAQGEPAAKPKAANTPA